MRKHFSVLLTDLLSSLNRIIHAAEAAILISRRHITQEILPKMKGSPVSRTDLMPVHRKSLMFRLSLKETVREEKDAEDKFCALYISEILASQYLLYFIGGR